MKDKELALAAQLGQVLAQITNLDTLLQACIAQIQETWSYYHVQVYLLDMPRTPVMPENGVPLLRLRIGSGEIGRLRQQQGIIIPLDARRSLVAEAAQTHEPVVVNRTEQHARHLPHHLLRETRAELAMPLMQGDQLVGVLDVQHDVPDYFDAAQVQVLRIVAAHLAAALQRIMLQADLAALRRHAAALHALTEAIREAIDQETLLAAATNIIGAALQAQNYGFRLIDADSASVRSHPAYHKSVGRRRAFRIVSPGEGVTGHVLKTGQPWRIPDVRQEPFYLGDQAIRSELCVPFRIDDEILGVINVESTQLDAFSEADERFLLTVADQLAEAVKALRLETMARLQLEERQGLLVAMRAISSLQLDNVLNTLGREARHLLNGDECHVHLLETDGETLRGVVALTQQSEALRLQDVRLGQGVIGSVALSGVGEVVANARLDRRTVRAPEVSLREATAVLAPLKLRQQVLGVMTVLRLDLNRPYTATDLNLLLAIAEQAAVAIENARLFAAERRKREELSVLHLVASAGAEATTEEDLFEQVTRLVSQRLFTDNFGILLLDKAGSVLRTHRSYWGAPRTIPVEQSLAGRTLLTGQPLRLPDVTRERGYYEADNAEPGAQMRSKLCVPLKVGGSVIGLVNAEDRRVNAFDRADEHLLTTLARQLDTALARVRLFEAEWRYARQQETLVAASGDIMAALNWYDLWVAVTKTTQEVLGAERTAVYLITGEPPSLMCIHAEGFSIGYPETFNQTGERAPESELFHRPGPIVVNRVDAERPEAPAGQLLWDEGVRAYALFALQGPRGLIGCLGIYRNQPAAFSQNEVDIGETLAHIVTVALRNVQLFTETQHSLMRARRLNDVFQELQADQDLPHVLSTVVYTAVELIGAEAGVLGLVVDGNVIVHYPYNLPDGAYLEPVWRGEGLEWHIVETEEPLVLVQYGIHPQAQASWLALGVEAFMGAPIMHQERCQGVLSVLHLSPSRMFTEDERQLLAALARQAGFVIHRLRARNETEQRVNSLVSALSRQEALEQRKDTFIQNISHELRTPLGIVLGHAELLESGMLGDLEAAQQESIGIVARRVQMLVSLVEDLSVMLAAQTQEFRREMLHPKQMVDAMLADFHLQAEARGLQLVAQVAEKLPWIRGDSTHLRRVFDNLMSNAFKFTPQGGQVQLTVWQQEGNVLFEVRDTGMGMPANQLTHIFDRFYQVKYKDHVHPGGTGLGLSLVKEIVEAHRGEIRVESEEGRGAAFIIRLPGVIHEEAPALEHGDGGAGEALGDLDARGEGVA